MPIIPASKIGDPEVLQTGTFLDDLTGIGGLPFERIVEFIGEEKTGKSTASFHVIASAQQQGLKCLLVDVEHSFTEKYAKDLGIDTDKLDVMRAQYAEDYLNDTIEAVESGEYQLVVLDSVGSLSSRVEAEKAVGEKVIGQQASPMATFMRKIAPQVSYHKSMLIVINHFRQEIGGYQPKTIAMGGKALREKKKLSLRFRETGSILKSGENVVGKVINVRVEKNAVGPTEKREVDVQLIFGQGFSASANLLQVLLDRGIITKTGNTFYLDKLKLGTISKTREYIKDHESELQATLGN